MEDVPLFQNIETLPRHEYPFLWADYVELRCLLNRNGIFSKGNIQEKIQESEDIQTDANEDIVAGEESEDTDDRMAFRWDDVQYFLRIREKSFPVWPFELDNQVLRRKFNFGDAGHCLYVALLVASSLRLCDKKQSHEVTSAFEEISFHWLRRFLSDFWEVRPFGAHQRLPGAYDGTKREKFEKLSVDIVATLTKSRAAYDPKDTGDAGIDLVAWHNMGDSRGNIPVIFGQCACSPKDWESKQLEVVPSSTEAHIQPQHPAAAYCFVPHDLSQNDTTWWRAANILRTVVIDRVRILHLFKQLDAWADVPKFAFLAKVVGTSAEQEPQA
jgi:hypothetical protein